MFELCVFLADALDAAADHMGARLMIDHRKLNGRAAAVDHEQVAAFYHVHLLSKAQRSPGAMPWIGEIQFRAAVYRFPERPRSRRS